MAMKEPYSLDYDRLAPSYDQRYRESSYAGISALIDRVRARTQGPALEVGCGTGHWLPLLSQEDATTAGLDPSLQMLGRAQVAAPAARLCQGLAERMPFTPGSFGVIYCINAVHHFAEPRRFLRAAQRSLRADGALVVVGLNAQNPNASWYIYDYFDGVQIADRKRYPRWDDLARWLREAGFKVWQQGVAESINHELVGSEVLSDPFLKRSSTSQLALLNEGEYRQGIERIRGTVARAEDEGEPARFRVELELRYLWARSNEGGSG